MKIINKIMTVLAVGLLFNLTGCTSTQVEKTAFENETGLNVATPMRFFTWVKADGSKSFFKDYTNRLFTLSYDSEADYMVKVETLEGVKNTTWGKQLTEVTDTVRSRVFTAFIAASYSMAEDKDAVDSVFAVLSQIFADPMYAPEKKNLPQVLIDGLNCYQNKTEYEEFKSDNFVVSNKTISIK